MNLHTSTCATILAAISLTLAAPAVRSEWEWLNPLPQGSFLGDVRALSPDEAYAVIYAVGLLVWDGEEWAVRRVPGLDDPVGLWTTPAGELYVAGGRGGIARWDGDVWTTVHGSTETGIWFVWGCAPDTAFAVTGDDRILRWDGLGWTVSISVPDSQFRALWGLGPDDFFAGGATRILHWDGVSWTEMATSPDWCIAAFWGRATDDVFAALNYSAPSGCSLIHWDGLEWAEAGPAVGACMSSITGFGPDVFAVGLRGLPPPDGLVLHWDGTDWAELPEMPTFGASPRCIHGTSASDLLVTGHHGLLRHWDGSVWESIDSRYPWEAGYDVFWAVHGFATGEVFVAGESGVLASAGSGWTDITPGEGYYRSIWGAAPDDVWAGGSGLAHWDGLGWTTDPGWPGASHLDGLAPDEIYALSGGTIYRWNGSDWLVEYSAVGLGLHDLCCLAPGDVIAVGAEGSVLRGGAGTWGLMPAPTGDDIMSVWGSAVDDVYALARLGGLKGGMQLLHHDGSGWTTVYSSMELLPEAVFGTGPTDVYVTSYGGSGCVVLHWDGQAWSDLPPVTTEFLGAGWGPDAGEMIMVGGGQNIVRWRAPPAVPATGAAGAVLLGVVLGLLLPGGRTARSWQSRMRRRARSGSAAPTSRSRSTRCASPSRWPGRA